jgi:hypothetical protein
VKWSGRLAAPTLGLGLFEEPTSAECLANLYNQDACNQLCYAAGITGYGAVLITPCQNQCMIEMCNQGILPPCKLPPSGWPCNPLTTTKEMQKAGVLLSPCIKKCMDAYSQGVSPFGTDEEALKTAARDCLKKCGIAAAVTASSTVKTPSPATKKPSSTPLVATTPSGGGGGIVIAVVAVALGLAALFLAR